MQIHASCVARDGNGLLLLGPSGAGKSDLALRLIGRGFVLVADDRVELEDGLASPPPPLAGLLEVRGLGIVRMPYEAPVRVALALRLEAGGERLPVAPEASPVAGLAVATLRVDPREAGAPERAAIALDCASGRRSMAAGAFA